MNILIVGHGAREHAIAEALARSPRGGTIYALMKSNNPGIAAVAQGTRIASYNDVPTLLAFARSCNIDWAIIGPEDPLALGVVDALRQGDIPAVGPTQRLAQLETSKSFTRQLLAKYGIVGNPRFRVFSSLAGIASFIEELGTAVIKPDGLTGGKGVLVQGEHFHTPNEGLRACEDILAHHPQVVVEEKLEGEEFSMQCFCDGDEVVATPLVQDHKRRFPGDCGPNTGGMGSYSCADHALPFLTPQDSVQAWEITKAVNQALRAETGERYHGILYGGFIATAQGVKLLEYNARLGDPEAMNILPLLETDFIDLCEAIIEGTLKSCPVTFASQATVCKYVVPRGYGLPVSSEGDPSFGARIEIGDPGQARIYYSSVDKRPDGLYMTTSRAIGLLGMADDLAKAEKIAEEGCLAVKGPVDHRPDIGTWELITRRISHMERLRRGR